MVAPGITILAKYERGEALIDQADLTDGHRQALWDELCAEGGTARP